MVDSGQGKVVPMDVDSTFCARIVLLYNFDRGSSRLKFEHQTYLDQTLAELLQNCRRHSAELNGYADESDGAGVGLDLSFERADAVKRYLLQRQVTEGQLSSRAFGTASFSRSDHDPETSRSVQVKLTIQPTFRILLRDASIIRYPGVVTQRIRIALEGPTRSAGRQLDVVSSSKQLDPDLTVTFDRDGRSEGPCRFTILGNEGGCTVFIGAHSTLFECPERGKERQGEPALVFPDDDEVFAQALANTAIHELGHRIAELEHTSDLGNYMYSQQPMPDALRGKGKLRAQLSGKKTFTPQQEAALSCAIRSANYRGGAKVQ